jgi:hypothetical protein
VRIIIIGAIRERGMEGISLLEIIQSPPKTMQNFILLY